MPFKVSVCLITYNQEKYIAQAIESVLMQKTSFDVELVIGDDFSTDRTQDIIRYYWNKDRNAIRPIFRRANIGAHQNLLNTMKECTGQYIALLEGDDYWLSPDKLEKQVKFLDDNPSFAQCYHKCKIANSENPPNGDLILERSPKKELALVDLLSQNIMPTCSVAFRNDLIGTYPEWINDYWFLDWILHILHAEHGKTAYLDECYGVYRVHNGSLTSNTNPIKQYRDIIAFQIQLREYFSHKYDAILDKEIVRNKFFLAKILLKAGQKREARQLIKSCCCHLSSVPGLSKREMVGELIRAYTR